MSKRGRSFEDNSSSPISKRLQEDGSKSQESESEGLLIQEEPRNLRSRRAEVSVEGNSKERF